MTWIETKQAASILCITDRAVRAAVQQNIKSEGAPSQQDASGQSREKQDAGSSNVDKPKIKRGIFINRSGG